MHLVQYVIFYFPFLGWLLTDNVQIQASYEWRKKYFNMHGFYTPNSIKYISKDHECLADHLLT